MKENKTNNELFVQLHEDMRAQGKTDKEIEAAAIEKCKLGGSDPGHTYRAMKARLADPKKYGGIYSERMKKFQKQPKKKTVGKTNGGGGEPVQVEAPAAPVTEPETTTVKVETEDGVVDLVV